MAKKVIKKNIWIVEDDPDINELIEIVLTNEGYKVKTFGDGGNIEKEIKKGKPNLIIMDLSMPGIGGAALTKKLKSKPSTKKIPIVLVSAKNSLEKIAKSSKADGFLPKPFDLKDLVSCVKKFV